MTYFAELTELVTAILVGVLFSIFLSAFFILVLLLKRKTRIGTSYFTKTRRSQDNYSGKPEIKLIKAISPNIMQDASDVSIVDEFCDNFSNYSALNTFDDDPLWAEQASSLISHCMTILMNCRTLTEKLTGLAMSSLDEWDPQMAKLVDIAKVITVRVDQFVSSMRPPLKPSVLEARAASLTLAVTHLAIMTQFELQNDKLPVEWVSKLLNNIQQHIDLLNCEAENICQSRHSFHQLLNTPINIQG